MYSAVGMLLSKNDFLFENETLQFAFTSAQGEVWFSTNSSALLSSARDVKVHWKSTLVSALKYILFYKSTTIIDYCFIDILTDFLSLTPWSFFCQTHFLQSEPVSFVRWAQLSAGLSGKRWWNVICCRRFCRKQLADAISDIHEFSFVNSNFF